jgi:DNA repair exonuclease SbcCD nuclease subunit
MDLIRILFLSDTHLGFDSPRRPRVERRRRGPDFFDNYERALAPAHRSEADLVVHGGDLLYRSRVAAELVERALRPLKAVADRGIPVYVVPGNHERSRIPFPLLACHPRLFVFDEPRTFVFEKNGFRLALAGFPHARRARQEFPALVGRTALSRTKSDAAVLVCHQAFEGARVGPSNFTFRDGSDVVRARDIPPALACVLSGHIHRAQALTFDVEGRRLPAPVLYPGSIERTSFAEKSERKGYLLVALEAGRASRGRLRGWRFHELPARPMVAIEVDDGVPPSRLEGWLRERLASLPPDAVVSIGLRDPSGWKLTAAALRSLAPPTMNVNVSLSVGARSRPSPYGPR